MFSAIFMRRIFIPNEGNQYIQEDIYHMTQKQLDFIGQYRLALESIQESRRKQEQREFTLILPDSRRRPGGSA